MSFKRIISLFLCLFICIQLCFTVSGSSNNKNSVDPFLINQEKSIDNYSKIIKKIKQDSVEKITNACISEYYGGAYIDGDGLLNVNLTDDSTDKKV